MGLMSAPASTKYLGGEFNSPVVEWLNKGLTAVWNPTVRSVMDTRKGGRGVGLSAPGRWSVLR
eukprot:1824646-Pyramimonas_sp.AAC.2